MCKDGDPIDDAIAIDEATSAFTSPRCKAVSFFLMKDLARDVVVDAEVTIAGVVQDRVQREQTFEQETFLTRLTPELKSGPRTRQKVPC